MDEILPDPIAVAKQVIVRVHACGVSQIKSGERLVSFQTIELTVADHLARLTLKRPHSANAINPVMAEELWLATMPVRSRLMFVRC